MSRQTHEIEYRGRTISYETGYPAHGYSAGSKKSLTPNLFHHSLDCVIAMIDDREEYGYEPSMAAART